jgi:transposase
VPAPYPEEFKQRAMQMVRDGESVISVAKRLGIAESGLRRWLDRAEVDAGRKPGLTTDERKELAELRRKNRRLAMENEILKRAAAYFAQENVLPKG